MTIGKFGRNYRLVLLDNLTANTGLELRNDKGSQSLTIDFDIQRGVGADLNSMTLRIYNLSRDNQAQLFQARLDLSNKNTFTARPIILQAGYNDGLSVIFRGGIREAFTFRQGNDLITQVEALDGILSTTQTYANISYDSATTAQQIVDDLVAPLTSQTDVEAGQTKLSTTTAALIGDNQRGYVIAGNAYNILQEYTSNKAFIDLGELSILSDNECIRPSVRVIDADTGLLGIPRLDGLRVTIETIFEPRINVGEFIEVQSSVAKQFNGQYKVAAVQHKGMLSDTVAGDARSIFQLYGGDVADNLVTIN
jgi:hypothetical protein